MSSVIQLLWLQNPTHVDNDAGAADYYILPMDHHAAFFVCAGAVFQSWKPLWSIIQPL